MAFTITSASLDPVATNAASPNSDFTTSDSTLAPQHGGWNADSTGAAVLCR